VVPGASGHTGTLHRVSVTPSADTTSSKLTFSVPSGTTGSSLTVSEAYGVPGATTATRSGTVVTLQLAGPVTLRAGIRYSFAVGGLSMASVANDAYTSGVTLYDSAGSTAVGWARSTTVKLTAGLPSASDVGYGSMSTPSSSVAITAGSAATLAVSPAGTTSSTAAVTVQTGNGAGNNLNGGALTASSTALTEPNHSTVVGTTTANVATGTSLTAVANRWGTGIGSISSTGTRAAGLAGSNYAGTNPTPQSLVTNADGSNTYVINAGLYADWLLPAGVYMTTYTFGYSGGS
jgi:hypothetical protein